jgi:hypothetical protein
MRKIAPLRHKPPSSPTPSSRSVIAMFRDQSLKSELARLAEQIRADFSLFEIAHENAIRSAG